jgi:hypothetical protein
MATDRTFEHQDLEIPGVDGDLAVDRREEREANEVVVDWGRHGNLSAARYVR